ncbi:MAG TPA: DNA polymerase Y family protein [Polyangiaceae bacterium]|nr:DNA polymerase Y family protein [Polyangiaceae bacterium]
MISRAPLEPAAGTRRVAAIVLPALLCEIAGTASLPRNLAHANGTGKRARSSALAVVLLEHDTTGAASLGARNTPAESELADAAKPTSRIAAANEEAYRFGIREDQTVAEACALFSGLKVRCVTHHDVHAALARVADIARAFGPTVSIESPDTIWIDVTGVAHLLGGERELAIELASRVRSIGHVTRVAVASGPRLARAFAKWSAETPRSGGEQVVVVEPAQTAERLARLPISALPLEPESSAWLVRLGVLSVGELAALPRAASAARLGKHAASILSLCEGLDPEPLVPHEPPRVLVEHSTWEEGVDRVEALLFVLRGLAARMSARLAGRGEAAQKLVLGIEGDVSIAQLNGAKPHVELEFELVTPLWREQEILRVVAARLERQQLETPSVGLRLRAEALTSADGQQLDLSRVASGLTACRGLEQLPVLLAELQADIGKECVGVLSLVDSLRPEHKSELVPALAARRTRTRRVPVKAGKTAKRTQGVGADAGARSISDRSVHTGWPRAPSRLLQRPVPLDAVLRVGATLAIEEHLYSIERIEFEQRLDAVEWWSRTAVARDYLRLWLGGAAGGLEAIVYVDRNTGARFLHGIAD